MRKVKSMSQNNHTVFNQTGAVLIIAAVSLVVMLGFAALAIDFGRRMVVENEVQIAVDAGALAGGRALYLDDGSLNIAGANAIAQAATGDNSPSGQTFADVTVKVGNWTFSSHTFVELQSSVDFSVLIGLSPAALDARTDFINAVQVTAATTGVTNFLGGLFGYADFDVEKNAVAWRGFAGGLGPGEADQPIAICLEAIQNGAGTYDCSIGRMLTDNDDTARWTDFEQGPNGTCPGGAASANVVGGLVDCSGGVNEEEIPTGNGLGTTNSVQASTFMTLEDCFLANDPPRVMKVTLPVIDCTGSNTCGTVVGAVNVDIVWVKKQNDPNFDNVPTILLPAEGDDPLWEYADNGTNGEARWESFRSPEPEGFNLKNDLQGTPAIWNDRTTTIFFKPSCEKAPNSGPPGGVASNVWSKYPKLVE
jgi:Flp pilus assembly protein TadG